MKVVNLGLAKQLKEIGYPQETGKIGFYWSIPEDKEEHAFVKYARIPDENNELYKASGNKSFAAPSADEIIDRLPLDVSFNKFEEGLYMVRWLEKVSMDNPMAKYHREIEGNLAEAAGRMWLYLKKEKLI